MGSNALGMTYTHAMSVFLVHSSRRNTGAFPEFFLPHSCSPLDNAVISRLTFGALDGGGRPSPAIIRPDVRLARDEAPTTQGFVLLLICLSIY